MKTWIVIAAAAGMFVLPAAAQAACDMSFQLDGRPAYDKVDFKAFIDNEVRPLMVGAPPSAFVDMRITTRCSGADTTAVLHMQKANYYILAINGQQLTKVQYTYKTSDVVISDAALEAAVRDSQNIGGASDQTINDWVKIFAYYFAESARFSQIEAKADGLLSSTSCGENWIDTVNLVRRWRVSSDFARNTNATGGMVFDTRHILAAPIGAATIDAYNRAANNPSDPARQFVDQRDLGKSLAVPDPSCEVVTSERGFLKSFTFIFSKPKIANDVQ